MGDNARDRTVAREEYEKLLTEAAPHIKPMMIASMHTGMRQGELRKLRWSMIDRENWIVRLPAEITKNGKPRNIPLNYHVQKVLKALPRPLREDLHVFTHKGRPITKGIHSGFERACERAGIVYGQNVEGGLRFHDLRASFDTNLELAGVSDAKRKALMGHSQEGQDKHYIRFEDSHLREAVDQYTNWFDTVFSQTGYQTGHHLEIIS